MNERNSSRKKSVVSTKCEISLDIGGGLHPGSDRRHVGEYSALSALWTAVEVLAIKNNEESTDEERR